MAQNIGIDLGLGFVKSSDGRTDYIFPSVVGAGQELTFQSELTSFTEPVDNLAITVADKKYFVGELAIRQSEILSRSLSDNHAREKNTQVILLAVLALYCVGDRGEFNVITGLPPGFYLGSKDDLAALIQGEHRVVFNVDGVDRLKTITVPQVKIIPQPMGTLFHRIFDERGVIRDRELAREKVGIIDIGFRTTDYVLVDKLEYIDKLSMTKTTAMSNLYGIVSDYLHREYRIFKEDFDMEDVIRKGELKLDGEFHSLAEIKKEAAEDLSLKILTELNSIWDKRALDTILLSGGGGAALADYLLPELKTAVLVDNAQTANVRGYLKLGQKVFGSGGRILVGNTSTPQAAQPGSNGKQGTAADKPLAETAPAKTVAESLPDSPADTEPSTVQTGAVPGGHETDGTKDQQVTIAGGNHQTGAVSSSGGVEVLSPRDPRNTSENQAPGFGSQNHETDLRRNNPHPDPVGVGNDTGPAKGGADSSQRRPGIDRESFRSNLDKLFSR